MKYCFLFMKNLVLKRLKAKYYSRQVRGNYSGWNLNIKDGATDLFAAYEVETGSVFGRCYANHSSKEFLHFLKNYYEKNTKEKE
jgi:hypothetical protein